jgi:hypothetical protein
MTHDKGVRMAVGSNLIIIRLEMNITISKRAQSQHELPHKYKPKLYSYEL